MTREQVENQRVSLINNLIDLTNEASQVWKFHPENPNFVDPAQYHLFLVKKIKDIELQITTMDLMNEGV